MVSLVKAVPGFDGYFADAAGVIHSARRGPARPLSPSSRNGYDTVVMCRGGRAVRISVHRAVALAYHGEPFPGNMICRHLNDDRRDNRPANLAWGTHADNRSDAHRNQRYRSEISRRDVIAIRHQASHGVSNSELMQVFGISGGQVSKIVSGQQRAIS